MEFNEALEALKLKFSSSNSIDISRTTITQEKWETILPVLDKYKKRKDGYLMKIYNWVSNII